MLAIIACGYIVKLFHKSKDFQFGCSLPTFSVVNGYTVIYTIYLYYNKQHGYNFVVQAFSFWFGTVLLVLQVYKCGVY